MLRELPVRKQENDYYRLKRWFQDDYFDLFIWQDDRGNITAFQLCYDRAGQERLISWDTNQGFSHHYIDDGEASPHKNMTPVMVESLDCLGIRENVIPRFKQVSYAIEPFIATFICDTVLNHLNDLAY